MLSLKCFRVTSLLSLVFVVASSPVTPVIDQIADLTRDSHSQSQSTVASIPVSFMVLLQFQIPLNTESNEDSSGSEEPIKDDFLSSVLLGEDNEGGANDLSFNISTNEIEHQPRFRRSTSLRRQLPIASVDGMPVPLTPVIEGSLPHTDEGCTLESCKAKCVVNLQADTCIPQCLDSACYCKCPNPDNPIENMTPLPPVQLVPDVQFQTPEDYLLRPPISPPLDDLNPRPLYPTIPNNFYQQYNQFGYYPYQYQYPGGATDGIFGLGQFDQYGQYGGAYGYDYRGYGTKK